MTAEGYTKIYWFRGGMPEWREKRMPVEGSAAVSRAILSRQLAVVRSHRDVCTAEGVEILFYVTHAGQRTEPPYLEVEAEGGLAGDAQDDLDGQPLLRGPGAQRLVAFNDDRVAAFRDQHFGRDEARQRHGRAAVEQLDRRADLAHGHAQLAGDPLVH